jgi:hypothetical protein
MCRWPIAYRDGLIPTTAPGATAAGAGRLPQWRVALRGAPNGLTVLDAAMTAARGECKYSTICFSAITRYAAAELTAGDGRIVPQ